MGAVAIKAKIRFELIRGWAACSDLTEAKQRFDTAHELANGFVRLHVCAHASLCAHAVLSRDPKGAIREAWLTMAAGPVTIRDRITRIVARNHS